MKVNKYYEAFDLVCMTMDDDKTKHIIKQLNDEGYPEKSICFSIWRGGDKILKFRYDDRLVSIIVNEVRKYGYKYRKSDNGRG